MKETKLFNVLYSLEQVKMTCFCPGSEIFHFFLTKSPKKEQLQCFPF